MHSFSPFPLTKTYSIKNFSTIKITLDGDETLPVSSAAEMGRKARVQNESWALSAERGRNECGRAQNECGTKCTSEGAECGNTNDVQ